MHFGVASNKIRIFIDKNIWNDFAHIHIPHVCNMHATLKLLDLALICFNLFLLLRRVRRYFRIMFHLNVITYYIRSIFMNRMEFIIGLVSGSIHIGSECSVVCSNYYFTMNVSLLLHPFFRLTSVICVSLLATVAIAILLLLLLLLIVVLLLLLCHYCRLK